MSIMGVLKMFGQEGGERFFLLTKLELRLNWKLKSNPPSPQKKTMLAIFSDACMHPWFIM